MSCWPGWPLECGALLVAQLELGVRGACGSRGQFRSVMRGETAEVIVVRSAVVVASGVERVWRWSCGPGGATVCERPRGVDLRSCEQCAEFVGGVAQACAEAAHAEAVAAVRPWRSTGRGGACGIGGCVRPVVWEGGGSGSASRVSERRESAVLRSWRPEEAIVPADGEANR